jgi:SAM-dependent methyltransferase
MVPNSPDATGSCDCGTTRAAYAIGVDAYDAIWSPVILPPAVEVVRRLDLDDASVVVDVGAGTGALTKALHDAAPNATIVSLDRSAEMLRHGRHHHTGRPVLADAGCLPLASDCADALIVAYVLFMLDDPARAIGEAARVVHSGGWVGTVTWASEQPSVAALEWDRILNDLGVPGVPSHSNHIGLDTVDAVEQLLDRCGLDPRQVWIESIDYHIAPADFWHLRTKHGVNALRLAHLAAEPRVEALALLRERLRELAPECYRAGGSMVCSTSVRRESGAAGRT